MESNYINVKLTKDNLESYIIHKEIFKSISNVLPLFKGNVLDSGCGIMPDIKFILENREIVSYIGLDIELALDYKNIKRDFYLDGIIMPFESKSFDVVISTEVLEHVPNPDAYLKEVKRVLKPGGSFFYNTFFNVLA